MEIWKNGSLEKRKFGMKIGKNGNWGKNKLGKLDIRKNDIYGKWK